VGGQRVLLDVPRDRFVVLYEHAERIWDRIEAGEHDIAALIRHHVTATGVDLEVASYQVITFLDELRAEGFIDYDLPAATTPLIDMPLSLAELRLDHVVAYLHGRRPLQGAGAVGAAVVVDDPKPDITLAELRAATAATVAGVAPRKRIVVLDAPSAGLTLDAIEQRDDVREHWAHFAQRTLITLQAPDPDLRLDELEQIAQLAAGAIPERRRGKTSLVADPRRDLTIGDLEVAGAETARVVVVIVIIFGPVIVIIVVFGPAGGPSSGKSRSACKTMCV
jgi:hypothetical protein